MAGCCEAIQIWVHRAAQLLPVRLRNNCFEAAVPRSTGDARSSAMFERERVGLFISSARTMPILAVPKNEPAANDGRDAMASTRAIGAWTKSLIPSYAR